MLAHTGPGPGLWVIAFAGLMVANLGFLILTAFYRPRELIMIAHRKTIRMFGGS